MKFGLTVLFEDDALIAFDKPSGLLVAPDRWDKDRPNLMDMVHRELSPEWFNAHRLDCDASGVLLCAKTKEVLKDVCRFFERGGIPKEYLALTRGVPREEKGTIRLALRPDESRPGRMHVVSEKRGKACETVYEVVERWHNHALVRLNPLTGRTHQIRVHLAALGTPIIGDAFYGNGRPLLLSELKPGYKFKRDVPEKPLLGRLALHSHKLSFSHPVTHAPVTIESPLPKDFQISIKYLRRWA